MNGPPDHRRAALKIIAIPATAGGGFGVFAQIFAGLALGNRSGSFHNMY
jgi:hypothetical protein